MNKHSFLIVSFFALLIFPSHSNILVSNEWNSDSSLECYDASEDISAILPTTIPTGSFIINMGVVPQTIANGLKPYGLLFDLINDHGIPVEWAVNPSKNFDGIDFSHNGIDYSGGAFIIKAEFRSAAVNSTINTWLAQGVIGNTTVSDFSTEIIYTLTNVPNWVLDSANGDKVLDAFTNAGISDNITYKDPDELTCCDYLYVMPHADPEWSTHGNLYNWIQSKTAGGCEGWVYASCHAVSALENSYNPDTTSQQMNFLTTKSADPLEGPPWGENSLVLWDDHDDGDGNYIYDNAFASDAIAQFIGTIDGATENGSEQIYMPYVGADWNTNTAVVIYDEPHPDTDSGGIGEGKKAAKLAYGPAFNDSSNGYVMYNGGHDIKTEGGIEAYIATYRAYFNFSFLAAKLRGGDVLEIDSPPVSYVQGQAMPLSVQVSNGAPPYDVEWSIDPVIGTFADPFPINIAEAGIATTSFSTPNSNTSFEATMLLKVTDACNYVENISYVISFNPSTPSPPMCTSIVLSNPPNADLVTDLTTLATDSDGDLQPSGFSITVQPTFGSVVLDVNAVATYTPDFNNSTQDIYTYEACDDEGQCCTGTITINTECPTDPNTQLFGTVFIDGNGSGAGIDGFDYGFGTGALVRLYEDNAPTGLPLGPEDLELTDVSPASTNVNGGYVFSLDDTPNIVGMATTSVANDVDDVAQHHDSPFQLHLAQDKIRINQGNDNFFGLRFDNINVPQGATITNAFITLHVDGNEGGDDNDVTIKVQDSNDAGPWGAANAAISSIYNSSSLPATVAWNTGTVANNADFNTSNISSLIQGIVDKAGWLPNQAMVFTFETTSTNNEIKFEAFENSNSNEAQLTVEYTIPGTPATGDYIVVLDDPSVLPFLGSFPLNTEPDPVPTDNFQYSVNIASVGDSQCFLNLGVRAANNPPQAIDVTSGNIQSCSAQAVISPLNVVDPDVTHNIVSYTIETAPNSGELYINTTTLLNTFPVTITAAEMATLEFDPDPTFKGTITFTFSGTDDGTPALGSNIATYSIVVTNCPPETQDELNSPIMSNAGATPLDSPLMGTDDDGMVVCYEIKTLPPVSQGVLTLGGVGLVVGQCIPVVDAGNISFTPSGTYIGNVIFTFAAIDDDSVEDLTPATYTIPIINVPPVAQDVSHSSCFLAGGGASVLDGLLATDIDGTIASFNIPAQPSGGTLNVTGSITPVQANSLMYTPPALSGTYTFSYTATDDLGGVSNSATYTLNVSTAPTADNISTGPIPASSGATSIPAVSGTDDGTIVEYIFLTIPNVSDGILYANGFPVLVGDPLTGAEIANLTFDPEPAFTGNITFNYITVDDCGFESVPANYSILACTPNKVIHTVAPN